MFKSYKDYYSNVYINQIIIWIVFDFYILNKYMYYYICISYKIIIFNLNLIFFRYFIMIRFIDLHLVGIMVNMEDIDRQRLLLLVYINLGSTKIIIFIFNFGWILQFRVGMMVNIMIMEFNIIRVVLGMMFMVSNMLKLEFNR